ncbi:hypothetical protein VTN02DRAFT_482 [Thermoascus thermophilus]
MPWLVNIAVNLALSGAVLVLSTFLWNYLRSPLKSYPGPFAASFTNIWRFLDVLKGRCDITHNALHRKHGIAVRMGPNVLSLSDPNLISKVFTTKNPWKKSTMYGVNEAMVAGKRVTNLFATTDEKWHSTFIRPVKSLYSMTKVQDVEHCVDAVINLYLEKLQERFVSPGKACDMADYMVYFAWDTMSQVTFSETLGILEAGNDDRKILETSCRSLDYFAPVCQIPELDLLLDKNPVYRLGPPSFGWATLFSIEALKKRIQRGPTLGGKNDFLDKFLEAKKKHPELVDDNMVVTYLISNVIAGSDTTASSLCSAIYHILKHPEVHRKLREEIHGAQLPIPASWKDIQDLPYLNAVMKEAMRIHPGVGLMLERVVPEGGLALPDGRFVPAGTIVGMNPWVINRNEEVFGPNTDEFIPERWLKYDHETEEQFSTRVSRMKGCDLTFGAGSRVCIGRYLSQFESYKLIATMFTKFDIELADPRDDWKIINSWFVRQLNIPMVLKNRI